MTNRWGAKSGVSQFYDVTGAPQPVPYRGKFAGVFDRPAEGVWRHDAVGMNVQSSDETLGETGTLLTPSGSGRKKRLRNQTMLTDRSVPASNTTLQGNPTMLGY